MTMSLCGKGIVFIEIKICCACHLLWKRLLNEYSKMKLRDTAQIVI